MAVGRVIRRNPIGNRAPPREAKQWTADELPGPRTPASSAAGRETPLHALAVHVAPRDPAVSQGNRIRESARGEACQVRYVGICAHDPAHTIWSHARWGAQLGDSGRSMGKKALDVAGAYACTACDAAYDGQAATGMTRESLDLDWCFGHFRSLGILAAKGLV